MITYVMCRIRATLHYDHKIVRAFETHPKGCTMEFLKWDFMWSWAFKCNVKAYATGLSTDDISLPSYWCGPFYTISKIK